MAVFTGSRTAPGVYVGARRGPAPVARRRVGLTARARRRGSPVAVALAVVLTFFLFGLIYMTQILQSAALRTEGDALIRERHALERELQSLEGTIARWGAEPVIVERAGQLGLDRLGGKLRIPVE
jgi:hypothetical protein